jgi:hypothetical protein
MMSLETIRSMNDTATRRAAREGLVPRIIHSADDVRGIPHLGYRVPRGWKLVEKLFVDSSGFGSESEPAMTQAAFTDYVKAHPGYGWAVIEAGQFQCYVGRYEKKEAARG